MNELRNRGVADILIAVVDGLKGFPEAINAVFPEAIVQTCIVHLIRNSMSFASWKERKFIAQALRGVYRAETPEAGMAGSCPTGWCRNRRSAVGSGSGQAARAGRLTMGLWLTEPRVSSVM